MSSGLLQFYSVPPKCTEVPWELPNISNTVFFFCASRAPRRYRMTIIDVSLSLACLRATAWRLVNVLECIRLPRAEYVFVNFWVFGNFSTSVEGTRWHSVLLRTIRATVQSIQIHVVPSWQLFWKLVSQANSRKPGRHFFHYREWLADEKCRTCRGRNVSSHFS